MYCGLGRVEADEAGHGGCDVQLLCALANWDGSELITEAEVERDGRSCAPSVVGVSVKCRLVAVVSLLTSRTLSKPILVGSEIMEVLIELSPFIVAARALREALRGNVLTTVEADLEGVLAFYPADVIRSLIHVLDGELGGIAVRTDADEALIVELKVGELIKAGEGEVARAQNVAVTVVSDAELVGQVRSEGVVLRESDEMVFEGLGCKEDRQVRGSIFGSLRVVDITTADAVLGVDVPIHAGCKRIEVREVRRVDQHVAQGDVGRSPIQPLVTVRV